LGHELLLQNLITEDETLQKKADQQLVVRIANGDPAAFSLLYDRLSGPLYSLALKMLGDAAEAEDALQDVCLQIWRRAATYDSAQSSVFSWAVLFTRSRVIDRLRSRGRRMRVVTASVDDENNNIEVVEASIAESAADTVNKNEEATRVRSVLATLPTDQREAIEMAFFSELTHHEIATRLNQPLGTVKARIRRGLLQLRDRLRRSSP
jgi:RNA polymerase sigma-70 factor (ECF subfamily)